MAVKVEALRGGLKIIEIQRPITNKDRKKLEVYNILPVGDSLKQGRRHVSWVHYYYDKTTLLVLPSGRAEDVCSAWARILRKEFKK